MIHGAAAGRRRGDVCVSHRVGEVYVSTPDDGIIVRSASVRGRKIRRARRGHACATPTLCIDGGGNTTRGSQGTRIRAGGAAQIAVSFACAGGGAIIARSRPAQRSYGGQGRARAQQPTPAGGRRGRACMRCRHLASCPGRPFRRSRRVACASDSALSGRGPVLDREYP